MNFNHHIVNTVVPQATSAFSIPVKICDGLFMADHYIAQDTEFFQTNLITHVINCAGQQVHNNQKITGVSFLTFDWSENFIQNITQQKVISVTVNFIEQCRKQAGCMLINYFSSQSRPFCLLACYFMVRFKWSLYKTLEFLNSRKEDVELEPAFFDQLTIFAQKLQDKGLIRSKTWIVAPGMSDQQIVITNTYLNSKNKFGPIPSSTGFKNKNKNSVSWKKQLVIEHLYCPNSAIQEKADKLQKEKEKQKQKEKEKEKSTQRKSLLELNKGVNQNQAISNSREKREDSLKKTQKQQSIANQTHQILQNKTNIQLQKERQKPVVSASMTQMNVTRKWAELREMWLREKQNHNVANNNKEVSQKQHTPIIIKKDEQRINDRLQEKLSLLKKHEQKLQLQNSSKAGKKQYSEVITTQKNTSHLEINQDRIDSKSQAQKAVLQNQQVSRIVHNNWIIDNHQIGSEQQGHRNSKNKLALNPANKSVIIVKPNHGSSSLDVKNDKMKDSAIFNPGLTVNQSNSNHPSRSSLRKTTGSERKQQNNSSLNKENSGGAKFFRNEANEIITTKGRCNSAKPQRKQNSNSVAIGLGLTKNGSLKNKGKWKF